MTDEEMRKLIEDTIEAQHRADSFNDERATWAKANPPASPAEIDRLEAHLGARSLSLPPSFRQFLHIHNGIEGFMGSYGLSLRPANQIVESADQDLAWKRLTPAHRFVIASGNTASFIGFDPESVDKRGEMKVVLVNEAGETTTFDDFEDFLREQRIFFQDVADVEERDREGLEDD